MKRTKQQRYDDYQRKLTRAKPEWRARLASKMFAQAIGVTKRELMKTFMRGVK